MRAGSLPAHSAILNIALPFLLLGWPGFPDAHECVQPDSCGCFLVIDGESCPRGARAHFFHELVDGAPLRFRISGTEYAALSRRPRGNSFSGYEGGSWSEAYDYADRLIELFYEPGEPNCPKLGEACEYFDVNALIRFSSGGKVLYELRTSGTCGC